MIQLHQLNYDVSTRDLEQAQEATVHHVATYQFQIESRNGVDSIADQRQGVEEVARADDGVPDVHRAAVQQVRPASGGQPQVTATLI